MDLTGIECTWKELDEIWDYCVDITGHTWMKLYGHNWTDLCVLKYTIASLVDMNVLGWITGYTQSHLGQNWMDWCEHCGSLGIYKHILDGLGDNTGMYWT